eukprot:2267663-Pyramimonas_sp.AAC.1
MPYLVAVEGLVPEDRPGTHDVSALRHHPPLHHVQLRHVVLRTEDGLQGGEGQSVQAVADAGREVLMRK